MDHNITSSKDRESTKGNKRLTKTGGWWAISIYWKSGNVIYKLLNTPPQSITFWQFATFIAHFNCFNQNYILYSKIAFYFSTQGFVHVELYHEATKSKLG